MLILPCMQKLPHVLSIHLYCKLNLLLLYIVKPFNACKQLILTLILLTIEQMANLVKQSTLH